MFAQHSGGNEIVDRLTEVKLLRSKAECLYLDI